MSTDAGGYVANRREQDVRRGFARCGEAERRVLGALFPALDTESSDEAPPGSSRILEPAVRCLRAWRGK